MNTKRNRFYQINDWVDWVPLWYGAYIFGLLLGAYWRVFIDNIAIDLTYYMLISIVTLGISLILLGWLAERKGDSLENY